MKKLSKFAVILCSTGALTLSLGFMNIKDLNNAKASSQATPLKTSVPLPFAKQGNLLTVVTIEEQNMVEKSSALSGFVPQENGPGFFFEKVK